MTDLTERLDAIQARVDAATPGPWEVVSSQWHPPVIFAWDVGLDVALMDDRPSSDAEFIAAAPSDVAFLLDLARKQGGALERVEALADTFDGLGSHASYYGTEAAMETWLSAANHLRAALDPTP